MFQQRKKVGRGPGCVFKKLAELFDRLELLRWNLPVFAETVNEFVRAEDGDRIGEALKRAADRFATFLRAERNRHEQKHGCKRDVSLPGHRGIVALRRVRSKTAGFCTISLV